MSSLFLLHVFIHSPHTPWNDYTIITLQTHSSKRRKQHRNFWSSRWDCQSVVCEWRGPWDGGPRTQNGAREEKRRKKESVARGSRNKGHFCRRQQYARCPSMVLGKRVENPRPNILALKNHLFPPLSAWMRDRESQVLTYECFLFILSLCVLVVGVWLWLMHSKDIRDVKM